MDWKPSWGGKRLHAVNGGRVALCGTMIETREHALLYVHARLEKFSRCSTCEKLAKKQEQQ